jgi:hypothetical protein
MMMLLCMIVLANRLSAFFNHIAMNIMRMIVMV